MRQLLNTLFVTSEDVYLSLDGENVVANRGGEAVARYPLHTLQSIVSFSYSGASPALMGTCAKREIGLAFCTPRGRFLARISGQMQGNVLLRRTQYRVADDPSGSCRVARMMAPQCGQTYLMLRFLLVLRPPLMVVVVSPPSSSLALVLIWSVVLRLAVISSMPGC